MENSVMTTHGIVIEKLTIGWLQLLIGAFVVGGFTYTTANTYSEVVELKVKQHTALTKYVPIIEKLDSQSSGTELALNTLNSTMGELNKNLSVVLALRTNEKEEKTKLESKVDELTKEVTNLRLEVSRLKK